MLILKELKVTVCHAVPRTEWEAEELHAAMVKVNKSLMDYLKHVLNQVLSSDGRLDEALVEVEELHDPSRK